MKKFEPIEKLDAYYGICPKCRKCLKEHQILCDKCLENLVYNYKTKHKEGFIVEEYRKLVDMFPPMNMDKFYSALTGITCMGSKDGTIIYHCDILLALKLGIENRDMKPYEMD